MMGLSGGKRILTKYLAVLIQRMRVKHRHTDRQKRHGYTRAKHSVVRVKINSANFELYLTWYQYFPDCMLEFAPDIKKV